MMQNNARNSPEIFIKQGRNWQKNYIWDKAQG